MPAPFEEMSSLDRVVHEPARLAILTALSGCRAADFTFLQSLTGLTKGNLSTHLAKLEQTGLVEIEKTFKGKVPHTLVRLTPTGRDSIQRHWQRLEDLRKAATRWGMSFRNGTTGRRTKMA
jgi:DNA-binding transcriptional ArsR family regulator